jgi:hypothetical protein
LLSSRINYTCTNPAEHLEGLDHNSVYRYLKSEKLTPRLLWEKAGETLVQSAEAYLIFDDTVVDKSYSFQEESSGGRDARTRAVSWSLVWTEVEEQQGKLVKVKGFAQDMYLKLFRVVVSTDRTDYIITNDVTQSDTDEAQKESGHRWKVEQFHREEKEVTGIEVALYRGVSCRTTPGITSAHMLVSMP